MLVKEMKLSSMKILLNITKVTLGDEEKETKFELRHSLEFHGKPLHITIEPNTTKVNIYYSTTKDAVALQWLESTTNCR
jgi:leukotriene-A4 hydrolase